MTAVMPYSPQLSYFLLIFWIKVKKRCHLRWLPASALGFRSWAINQRNSSDPFRCRRIPGSRGGGNTVESNVPARSVKLGRARDAENARKSQRGDLAPSRFGQGWFHGESSWRHLVGTVGQSRHFRFRTGDNIRKMHELKVRTALSVHGKVGLGETRIHR